MVTLSDKKMHFLIMETFIKKHFVKTFSLLVKFRKKNSENVITIFHTIAIKNKEKIFTKFLVIMK